MTGQYSYSLPFTYYLLHSTNYHVLFTNYHVNHLIRGCGARDCTEKSAPNLPEIKTPGVYQASARSMLSIMYSTMPGRVPKPGPVPISPHHLQLKVRAVDRNAPIPAYCPERSGDSAS